VVVSLCHSHIIIYLFSVMFCNLFCTYYWGGDLQAITTRTFIFLKGNSICDCTCINASRRWKKPQIEFAFLSHNPLLFFSENRQFWFLDKLFKNRSRYQLFGLKKHKLLNSHKPVIKVQFFKLNKLRNFYLSKFKEIVNNKSN
jgi:hypothetical protein